MVDVGRRRKMKSPIWSLGGLSNWKGKEYEVTSPPYFIREFILPPEGTSSFLGCVCRNHSSASSWFHNCCPFGCAPTKQIGPNGEILLGSRSSSFSSPLPPSSGCPSPPPSHRKLNFTLWHYFMKSVAFFPSVTLLFSLQW